MQSFKKNLLRGIPLLLCTGALLLACMPKNGNFHPAKPEEDNRPDPNAALTDPPVPPPVTANPLLGARLFVDPQANVMLRANALRKENPEQSALLHRIAQEPQALWMGDWNTNVYRAAEYLVLRAKKDDAVPVMIAYNIPHRDYEGVESKQALAVSNDEYRRWIRNIYAGIGDNAAVVVLEPDALPGLHSLPEEYQADRLYLLNDAVRVFRQNPKIAVYIDAGHAAWVPAEKMADMLIKAGVEHASGFSLNTSNYRTTEECLSYGHEISALIDDKHFIIDTSRNGAGPYESEVERETWCNPPGRKIGKPPTTDTGDPLCDGFLWLKRPGESDGKCNGGPDAGVFWLEQALEYAR